MFHPLFPLKRPQLCHWVCRLFLGRRPSPSVLAPRLSRRRRVSLPKWESVGKMMILGYLQYPPISPMEHAPLPGSSRILSISKLGILQPRGLGLGDRRPWAVSGWTITTDFEAVSVRHPWGCPIFWPIRPIARSSQISTICQSKLYKKTPENHRSQWQVLNQTVSELCVALQEMQPSCTLPATHSLDWFKGKCTGNPFVYQIWGFPISVPFIHFGDYIVVCSPLNWRTDIGQCKQITVAKHPLWNLSGTMAVSHSPLSLLLLYCQ